VYLFFTQHFPCWPMCMDDQASVNGHLEDFGSIFSHWYPSRLHLLGKDNMAGEKRTSILYKRFTRECPHLRHCLNGSKPFVRASADTIIRQLAWPVMANVLYANIQPTVRSRTLSAGNNVSTTSATGNINHRQDLQLMLRPLLPGGSSKQMHLPEF
jgi:hypothetical protein